MAVATLYYQAADDILATLGIVPTAVNTNLLVAWMQQEYPPEDLAVTNNPLATSLRTTGVGGYCTLPNGEPSGEPCYDTLADGAAACAKTIAGGLYPHLLAALENSDAGTFFSSAGVSELGMWVHGYYGAPSYMASLQSTYQGLPTPPSSTPSGGTAPGGNPPTGLMALGVVGTFITGLLLIALALTGVAEIKGAPLI